MYRYTFSICEILYMCTCVCLYMYVCISTHILNSVYLSENVVAIDHFHSESVGEQGQALAHDERGGIVEQARRTSAHLNRKRDICIRVYVYICLYEYMGMHHSE